MKMFKKKSDKPNITPEMIQEGLTQLEELAKLQPKEEVVKKVDGVPVTSAEYVDEHYIYKKKKLPHKKIKHIFKKKFRSKQVIYVNMELMNGNHLTLLVSVKQESFSFGKNTYVVDLGCSYYNLTLKEWCLDYHEGLTLPHKREFPLSKIRQAVKNGAGIDDVIYSLNPITLGEYMRNNVIVSALKGASGDNKLKIILAFSVLSGVLALLSLIVTLWSSGVFNNIGL